MNGRGLNGIRILIPRIGEDIEYSVGIVKEMGGEPIPLEVAKIEYTSDLTSLDEALRNIEAFDWIIFTSKNCVRIFIERIKELGVWPLRCRLAAVGQSTQQEAEKHGLKISFTPTKYLTKKLAQEIPEINGKRVLLIRSHDADDDMRRILQERGAEVVEVRPYKVTPVRDIKLEKEFDVAIITSPSIARALSNSLEFMDRISKGALVCCIGPVTAEAAKSLGIRVDLVSEEHTFSGVVRALERCFGVVGGED